MHAIRDIHVYLSHVFSVDNVVVLIQVQEMLLKLHTV
jgi:hypothetical protein